MTDDDHRGKHLEHCTIFALQNGHIIQVLKTFTCLNRQNEKKNKPHKFPFNFRWWLTKVQTMYSMLQERQHALEQNSFTSKANCCTWPAPWTRRRENINLKWPMHSLSEPTKKNKMLIFYFQAMFYQSSGNRYILFTVKSVVNFSQKLWHEVSTVSLRRSKS